ncbi:MAG: GTP-binding protein, partial [Hyphomicrobiaceae bacterium]|nr:GTP-binding protein [Hyphomicrobiaceae bacterium]
QTFFMDDDVREKTRLDAVVTVVDARHLLARLDDSPEAEEQVAFADVILVNKVDLVNAQELFAVEEAIRAINPYATLYRTTRTEIDLGAILDRGAFDLERILELDPAFLSPEDAPEHDHVCGPDCDHEHHGHHHHHGHEHHHHDHHDHEHVCGPDCDHDHGPAARRHDPTVTSVSLSGGIVDPQKFIPWLQEVTQVQGPDILRLKGILAFPEEPKRYVVQGVHMIVEGDLQRDWRDSEARESRLVFIGRKLDAAALKAGFAACAA